MLLRRRHLLLLLLLNHHLLHALRLHLRCRLRGRGPRELPLLCRARERLLLRRACKRRLRRSLHGRRASKSALHLRRRLRWRTRKPLTR